MSSDLKTKLAIIGITGRMGREILSAVQRRNAEGEEQISVVAGIVEPGNVFVGDQLAGVDFPITDDWSSEFTDVNAIVDFSSPEGARKAISLSREQKIPAVICSTGLSQELEDEVRELSNEVLVLRATNTSVAVNVMFDLVRNAASMLGKDYDVEIVEVHHRGKRDAPSGTALTLAQEVAEVRNLSLEDDLVTGRFGMTGARKDNEIAVLALRGGDVAGEHTVYFFGAGERLEITQRSSNRGIFAEGAIRAAQWLVNKKASGVRSGLFSMRDVLASK